MRAIVFPGSRQIHGDDVFRRLVNAQCNFFHVRRLPLPARCLRTDHSPAPNIWVKVIFAPKALLLTMVAAISVVGTYGYNNSVVDVWVMFGFGLLGYVLKKYRYRLTPNILALVLGGILEGNLRRALIISEGEYSIFVTHPIGAVLLIPAALSLLSPMVLERLARKPDTVAAGRRLATS